MSVNLQSYNLFGIKAETVHIQVEVAKGMPHFAITGMASASIRESKDRIRSAIEQSDFFFPKTRKIVHLAPAEIPKHGSHFDLGIAIGILSLTKQIPLCDAKTMVLGELGLDGSIRKIYGLLPGLLEAKKSGIKNAIIPFENLAEASLIQDMDFYPVKNLREACSVLVGKVKKFSFPKDNIFRKENTLSLSDISGHEHAKRALMISATGAHHVLMHGPPGTGKSMLAKAFPSLLPEMRHEDKLETMQIYSVAGMTQNLHRPFRAVHHSASRAQLLGGGTGGKPGELSLAHKGVLYLDELPEFKREVLESLRQPLEDGFYYLSRNQRDLLYPCNFQLVASMNPCPCGFYGDIQHTCKCSPYEIARYKKKLSGPLMDRLDIFIPVPRLSFEHLHKNQSENLATIQNRITMAQEIQIKRQGKLNGQLSAKEIKEIKFSTDVQNLLNSATQKLGLSGRAVHKCIKVALSIADLDQKTLDSGSIGEALSWRL